MGRWWESEVCGTKGGTYNVSGDGPSGEGTAPYRIGRNVLPGLGICLTEKGSNERPRSGLPNLWGVDAGGNKRGPYEIVGASYGYSILATSPDASYHLTNLLSQRFLPFCGPLGLASSRLLPRVPSSHTGLSETD
jgi:hypothetical protein